MSLDFRSAASRHTYPSSTRKQEPQWRFSSGGSSSCFALLETLPAEHRPALRGLERNCSFALAPGANCLGLYPLHPPAALRQAKRLGALALAVFAAFWLILELFIVEEKLLTCGEDEICSTIHAFQNLILELHRTAPFPDHSKGTGMTGLPSLNLEVDTYHGFGPTRF
jgi:hypothetical protein